MPEEQVQEIEDAKFGKEKLIITLSPGKPAQRQYVTRSMTLCRTSFLINEKVFKSKQMQTSSDQLTIDLDDEDCICRKTHDPDHFDMVLFEKFIVFCRNPKLLQDLEEVRKQVKEIESSANTMMRAVADMLYFQQQDALKDLADFQAQKEMLIQADIKLRQQKRLQSTVDRYNRFAGESFEKIHCEFNIMCTRLKDQFDKDQKTVSENKSWKWRDALERKVDIVSRKIKMQFTPERLQELYVDAVKNEKQSQMDICAKMIAEQILQPEVHKQKQIMNSTVQLKDLSRILNHIQADQIEAVAALGLPTFTNFSGLKQYQDLAKYTPAKLLPITAYVFPNELVLLKVEHMKADYKAFLQSLTPDQLNKTVNPYFQDVHDLVMQQVLQEMKIKGVDYKPGFTVVEEIEFERQHGIKTTATNVTFLTMKEQLTTRSIKKFQIMGPNSFTFKIIQFGEAILQVGVEVNGDVIILQSDGIFKHYGEMDALDLKLKVNDVITVDIDPTHIDFLVNNVHIKNVKLRINEIKQTIGAKVTYLNFQKLLQEVEDDIGFSHQFQNHQIFAKSFASCWMLSDESIEVQIFKLK